MIQKFKCWLGLHGWHNVINSHSPDEQGYTYYFCYACKREWRKK